MSESPKTPPEEDPEELQGTDSVADQEEELGLDDFRNPTEDQGLSLEAISAAFARMIDDGKDPYDQTPPEEAPPLPPPQAAEVEEEEEDLPEDVGCEVSPLSILEAMLFVGSPNEEELTSQQVAALMRGVRAQEIETLIDQLNGQYAEDGCPYQVRPAGSGFRLVLRDEYAALRDKFYGRIKEARLSQAAVDVLAIVAYRQPLTREEIDELRGRPSGGVLSQLVRRQLLRIERTEDKKRKAEYYTTERVLHLFRLETIRELPQSQEFDKIF
jgi:segregation and condensation protein B